jgi:hypothetical protein
MYVLSAYLIWPLMVDRRGTLRCQKVVKLPSVHGVATRRAQAKTLWDMEVARNHEKRCAAYNTYNVFFLFCPEPGNYPSATF